jgi:methyltransferase (TIGR00027 family)
MQDLTASRTALATALMRAAHTRLDPNPLINDPWGDRLVPEAARELFRQVAQSRMGASADDYFLASPAYANVIFRTRYTEDALKAAVAKGVRQYVIIGAGFDSFALRRPDFAADLEIFEIDHPATQTLKIEQLKGCGIVPPKSVHFIAADLAQRSVAQTLSDSPFRSDLPAFFSWLGVTMYLTREANAATLRSIASFAMPGSELAFTYIDEKVLKSGSESFQQLAKTVASLGEPFLSGFDPHVFEQELRSCGLTLIEDLNGAEIAARYGRANIKSAGEASRISHIALARVGTSSSEGSSL